MTGLGLRTHAAVVAATALVLLASACGTVKVEQSQRADVTAAPPPDGSHLVVEKQKKKATHKHRKKAAKAMPGVWPTMRDRKSGVTFALPTASSAALDQYPAPGGGMMNARNYAANTLDDLTLAVSVEDTSKFKSSYLPFMKPATMQWLTTMGATNVVDAGSSRQLTVNGQPAYEYGLLFDNVGQSGRGMMRVTVIALRDHLVIAETYSAFGSERLLRQGHVTSVHAKLMSHLRVA